MMDATTSSYGKFRFVATRDADGLFELTNNFDITR